MDTVTHLEYPERIVTRTTDKIVVRDLSNPIPQYYNAKDIKFLRKLSNNLILRIDAHYQWLYSLCVLNGKLEVKKNFIVNLCNKYITNIFPVLVSDHYLVLITVTNYYTYAFLIDLNQTDLISHPHFECFDGETCTVFQFGEEIITFQRNARYGLTCYVIELNKEMNNVIHHQGYETLTNHLASANAQNIIPLKDNELTVCAICCNRDLIAIFNSKGEITYKWDLFKKCEIAYDKYTNNIFVECEMLFWKGLCRIYKSEEKWVMEKYGGNASSIAISLVTRKKILTWNWSNHIILDKQTMDIICRPAWHQEEDLFYYDFYDKWLNDELERLLNVDVLKRMSRDILILILLYVS